ncbi:MAG: LysM peptidoglycan-binding domain-containing protein [Spirochaetia bacterium]|nr:LysM peptidoglycan-binding domain-containing protein [Spirochaetia bacterium]
MKKKMKNNKIKMMHVLILLIFIMGYCSDPVPIEEMSKAKHKITKAESVKADTYAPGYYRSAIDELKKAHNMISEDNMAEAKKHAEEAIKFADQAYSKSAPALAEETKKEADEAIKFAEKVFAEEFAASEFENAKTLFAEGDGALGKKDYITAFQKFEASREEARKARDIAESQAEIMKRNIAEIEDTIQEAIKYGAAESAPDAIRIAQEKLETAKEKVDKLDLKNAAIDIDEAAANARQALLIGQKDWAAKKLIEAETSVNNADKSISALTKNLEEPNIKKMFATNEEARAAMNSIQETLAAAKDSYNMAGQSIENEAYEDSVNQSDEAIRLATIINDQIPQIEVLIASAGTKGAAPPIMPTKEGWKKYTVRLIPKKRDCLWRIAEYDFIYNNPLLWPKIYKANKGQIKNPDLIFPGQIFDIPPKEGSETKPKEEKPETKADKGVETIQDTTVETAKEEAVDENEEAVSQPEEMNEETAIEGSKNTE